MDARSIVVIAADQNNLQNIVTRLSESYQVYSLNLPESNESLVDNSNLNKALAKSPVAILIEIIPEHDFTKLITRLRSQSEERSPLILGVLQENASAKTNDVLTQLPIDSFIFSHWSIERVVQKLDQLAQLQERNEALEIEVADTSQAAITAMKAASEVGLLMQLVEWLNTAVSIEDACNAMFKVCQRLELNAFCLVQKNQEELFFPDGLVHETAQKVLHEARQSNIRVLSRNRIVVFRLDYLVLMITNAPWQDEEKYGRVRDILLQAAALTEARTRTLTVNALIAAQHDQVQTIMTLIKNVSGETQMYARKIMQNLSSELSEAVLTLDLTEHQESRLQALSENALDSIEVLYSGSDALEAHFHTLVSSITVVKDLTTTNASGTTHKEQSTTSNNEEITLF